MKKITINRNIEICAALAFVLLSLSSVNFVSADNSSQSEDFPADGRFSRMKEREEMTRKIAEKKAEIENKMLKMKETKDRFDGKLEDRKIKFGTSTFSTSTVGFGSSASSTAPFRKKEMERIKKEGEKISKRFYNNIGRLEDFYDRISEKISKFEKKGVSVTETKALLVLAKSKIDIARADADVLMKAMEEGLGVQNRKNYFESIRNLSNKAKKSIKEAQRELSDAVNSLKPGFNKNKNNSSSTTISSVSSVMMSSGSISSNASSLAASSSASSSSSSL